MKHKVRRLFVEKKKGFDVEAQSLFHDLRENLGVEALENVRILNRYDVSGISDEEYENSRRTILSEPPVDIIYDEEIDLNDGSRVFAVEYLPGQFDQRADSASQCIQILTRGDRPKVRTAKVIILSGRLSEHELHKIKDYCINPVETREASVGKPDTLDDEKVEPADVEVLSGFINMGRNELEGLLSDMGLAMSIEDLEMCRLYFKDTENRDPTITELRVLDTYWSDHCRHTTFLTRIEEVDFEQGRFNIPARNAHEQYLKSREFVYGDKENDICLMSLATIAMKELRKRGRLDDLEVSEENNACSIVVNVDVNDEIQEWLVMFKNETHNHPTEIEPFGGAATCLGGCIRDPMSGRVYVYQAMRVTGSGDPRTPIEDTLPGKLPQRKITTEAAAGYSSYGNQIGLATGHVAEIYHSDYVAKRMEIGAVIGAAQRKNVIRESPVKDDVIILLGGRTGRDGCGGATGSSKEHDEESLAACGAEVQKGDAPTERKIQRLFRNPDAVRMIKKCNDFGAGGVSVAIGELAPGIDIDLDAVPKKYEGLDGTELAISESQERMAVVVSEHSAQSFIDAARDENLEATIVARVTDSNRVRMAWRGRFIVDISRDFLDTNGARQTSSVLVRTPDEETNFFRIINPEVREKIGDIKEAWLANLRRLDVCSRRGLVERFDSTIGAGTVLMPFGGKYQLTPAECMAAKIPVSDGETRTGTIMSYGYNPAIAKWSPFHGAVYAVVEAVSKVAAAGGNYKSIRLTLQEYFEKLGNDPEKWGKPFSALLGAYYAQMKLGTPAIGGKDSMSGTFKDLNVPPTLAAFAVSVVDVNNVISPEFKKAGSKIALVRVRRDENELPDFEQLGNCYSRIYELIKEGRILSAHTVKAGGLAEAISKMCFGNMIGFAFKEDILPEILFAPDYGSIVLEIDENYCVRESLDSLEFSFIGRTQNERIINVNREKVELDLALENWEKPLEDIFPTGTGENSKKANSYCYDVRSRVRPGITTAKPRVLIPVFPGTNCEYDTARAFEKAGAVVETLIVRNLTSAEIIETLERMARLISNSQIIAIPGGFSGGDEPDGSGKFIATAFRNPRMKEEVTNFLENRDGLMIGICNGFQALVKLGLVPYGEIRDMNDNSPTLTFNTIGRHQSKMVRTKVVSTLSPWLNNVSMGDIHTIPISHGEGRFVASARDLEKMAANGQIATQYVDMDGCPTYDIMYNPNGSLDAIEGITSPDGRIFGKMGHSERIGTNVIRNVPGQKDQRIFEAGVSYFK